jgi:hypothetical protein
MTCVLGFRAAGLAVVIAAAGWHEADAQAYKPPAVDTVFYLTDTAGLRVVEATPDSVITQNTSKTRVIWIGGMLVNVPPDDRARLDQLFPLAPGGRFAYTASNDGSRIEMTVQGPETFEVGGKPMPVMRVTRHHKGQPPSTFEGEYTIWYSVDYGFPLKMSYRHIAGGQPDFRDWQVVRITAPGSLDGVWNFRVRCSDDAWISWDRAVVRDGVVTSKAPGAPNTNSITDHDLRLTRKGDQVELSGTAANAGGGANTVSARGTLMPDGSVAGTGIMNTWKGVRSGCAFSAERY